MNIEQKLEVTNWQHWSCKATIGISNVAIGKINYFVIDNRYRANLLTVTKYDKILSNIGV